MHRTLRSTSLALLLATPSLALAAQDWGNLGGNAACNGLTSVVGPAAPDLAWQANEASLIAWAPYISEGRVFTVRQTGFPQNGGPAGDSLVALDLATGVELWRTTLPYGGDPTSEWIAWIAGARDGRVYASRSSNGQPAPLRALDAATGAPLWTSAVSTQAFAYDGVVFAPDGDLLVGDLATITRVEAADGSTVWSVPRLCPVSGNCGVAATDQAVFYDAPAPGGNVVVKLDLATGAQLAESSLMPGFTAQNSPFLSPDGSIVYFARSQNNTAVDELYAFADAGGTLDLVWSRPVRWTTSHRHGMAPDGSLYTFLPGEEFVRLDGATGDVLQSYGTLAPVGVNLSPYTAVDGAGRVYVTNGFASSPPGNGRLWALSGDLSTLLYTLNLQRPNQGGPALGQVAPGGDGLLVVCDLNAVRAYASDAPGPVGTPFCSSGPTSLGVPARISAVGSVDLGDQDLTLRASGVPDQPGLFYFGPGTLALPFGNGTRCVGGFVVRFPVELASGGLLEHVVDFASPQGAALAPGSTYLQAWFRDPAAGGAAFDLSDGLRLELR